MNAINRLLKLLMLILGALQISACSKIVQWNEEVKLNDGRTIVVTQKRRCGGGDYNAKTNATCIAREAWLKLELPDISDKEIIWHESLNPMIVNIHHGRLYVVGFPPHTLEFRAYGGTNPPYFGFLWDKNAWKRIDFMQIPKEIYDANMLIESIPKVRVGLLSLREKDSATENGDSRYPHYLRRIDPEFTTSTY